jgi:dihydropteroate synthase
VILDAGGKTLDLTRPQVMGILNVTPDSFSDGGRYLDPEAAVAQGLRLRAEGAAILDIGGESTRPGAEPVSVQQELDRVLPVIEALAPELDIPISIDTSKPEVMQAAVGAGAGMINDVNALRAAGALEAAAAAAVPVCLMHMQGEPRGMQQAPQYGDVLAEIKAYLAVRLAACMQGGIPRSRLLVDPGFGFGKTLQHNLALLAGLAAFAELGVPLLVGVSRKSMIGALTGRDPGQRLAGSLAAAVLAAERGARIIRVHDVAATVDALAVTQAVMATRVSSGRE